MCNGLRREFSNDVLPHARLITNTGEIWSVCQVYVSHLCLRIAILTVNFWFAVSCWLRPWDLLTASVWDSSTWALAARPLLDVGSTLFIHLGSVGRLLNWIGLTGDGHLYWSGRRLCGRHHSSEVGLTRWEYGKMGQPFRGIAMKWHVSSIRHLATVGGKWWWNRILWRDGWGHCSYKVWTA